MILFYSLKPDFMLHRFFFILDFPCEGFFFNVKKADKIIFIMLALMDLYVCALGGWHIKAPELPLIISSLTLFWNFHEGNRDIRECKGKGSECLITVYRFLFSLQQPQEKELCQLYLIKSYEYALFHNV